MINCNCVRCKEEEEEEAKKRKQLMKEAKTEEEINELLEEADYREAFELSGRMTKEHAMDLLIEHLDDCGEPWIIAAILCLLKADDYDHWKEHDPDYRDDL